MIACEDWNEEHQAHWPGVANDRYDENKRAAHDPVRQ